MREIDAGGPSAGAVVSAKTRIPRIAGLARERVDHRLASLWDHRLGLVVAPAGSGKTTLVAQFAAASGVPVGWWRAEAADASEAAAVAHLERALLPALDGVDGGWRTIDDVAAALDAWDGDRALLVVDDLHALWGTDAEAALERLLGLLPTGVALLAATRRAPGFNLPRLLVSGELLEIGPDDLRFRAWEVEKLFRDFYGSPMPPDELAELARRTAGWAAGLQLFHLATRGKPAGDRRRVLDQLGVRSRLLREYLARNVLDELPVHVRDFLVRTCVLGRMTPALCDELTGGTSSASVLAELEQRQIFTTSMEAEESYRYHEVLRSHLEGALVEQLGEPAARDRFRAAGELLERHGYPADALRAYGRAEAWEAVTRLLGGSPEELVDRPGDWLDALPTALLDHDPWLLLGTARRLAAQGRADEAIDAYRRAEAASGPGQPGDICRRERQAVGAWFGAAPTVPADWVGALRLATVRNPAAVAAAAYALQEPEGELVAGLALLLAGAVEPAASRLDALAARRDVSSVIATGAAIGAAAAGALAGRPVGDLLERCSETAEAAGLPWIAAVARAVALLDAASTGDIRAAGLPKDDRWGNALTLLCAGLGVLHRGDDTRVEFASTVLRDAVAEFRDLDAPVLGAWAAAGAALADGDASAHRRALQVAQTLGTQIPAGLASAPAPGPVAAPGVEVRCFGSFRLTVDGRVIDLSAVKPRVRSLLRYLALQGGDAVHRERIIECLWPDEGDVRVGTRNLQTAISSLRQLVEPGVGRGEATVVVRVGDTYRLSLHGPEASDVLAFRAAVGEARAARSSHDAAAAIGALRRALDLYAGDLLADEGPAEWLTGERDRCRLLAADAAQACAELAVETGAVADAVDAAERGIEIDPYRDGLWRALIRAYETAGDVAASRRVETRYAKVLRELGVD